MRRTNTDTLPLPSLSFPLSALGPISFIPLCDEEERKVVEIVEEEGLSCIPK